MTARIAASIGLLLLLCGDPSDAQTIPLSLAQSADPKKPVTEYVKRVRELYYVLDANSDDRLDAADGELHTKMFVSRRRGTLLEFLLSSDLDGDGRITEREHRTHVQATIRRSRAAIAGNANSWTLPNEAESEKEFMASFVKGDSDGDGVLTFAEQHSAVKREAAERSAELLVADIACIMKFDSNADRILTLAEFEAAAAVYYTLLDANGDGFVSGDEQKVGVDKELAAKRAERAGAKAGGSSNATTR